MSVAHGTIARMTSIDERLVHETAAECGVPGPVAQEFMARFRPCLYLVPHKEVPPSRREDVRSAARTGGLPALPDGVDWPEGRAPLVLSVDCAALPHDVLDIELPADGHLLFFTEIEYPPESFRGASHPCRSTHHGARRGVCVQIGGFSDPWDMAPDQGDLVLFAHMAG